MSAYGMFVMLGVMLSLVFWMKKAQSDQRMVMIFFGALAGAFIGAKLAYLISEGWLISGEDKWKHWLVGKSISGALLGGFLGVELSKKLVRYPSSTGDSFALIIPLGIIVGRMGCLSHGCCGGVTFASGWQWPSVPVEIGFNLITWLTLIWMWKAGKGRNQLFHIYLIAYGGFRFIHEFVRITPKVILGLSGYQWIALLILLVGIIAYKKRVQMLKREEKE